MADRALARRYAEAFVNALESARRTEGALKELGFVSQMVGASRDLRRFLGSPEIGLEEKRALLTRLFSDAVGPELMALLNLLLTKDRMELLPDLCLEAQTLAQERQGILHAQVTTRYPISAAETDRLAAAVGKVLGKRVVLERRVDPATIGGARVRIGTTLLDGSIQTILKRVKEQLLEVKVHSFDST